MAKQETIKQWDTYADEADVPDFVIQVKDGDDIRVSNPTGTQVMRISQGLRSGDLELILTGVCGDSYPAIDTLMGSTGHKAFPALVEDLMDHFDLYEEVQLVGPSGGTVKAKRPTKVKQLIDLGYKVKGE